MAKLQDIADQVGVSISTISRVLSRDETLSIAEPTRQRIVEVAKELGYVSKRKVRKQETIGIILLYNEKEELDDPYYSAIRIRVKEELTALRYTTKEYFSGFQPHHGEEDFSGFIVIGGFSDWKPEDQSILYRSKKPAVFVDFRPEHTDFDYIITSFDESIPACLNYVVDHGYEKIGYIGTQQTKSFGYAQHDVRERIFRRFLEKRKLLDLNYVHLWESDPFLSNAEIGYRSIHKAYEKNAMPEVFFAENDSIAIGALGALNELNLKVPQDIGIIGCNDNPTSAFLNPPLTTIQIHNDYMGKLGVELLIKRITDPTPPPIGMVIPSKLVFRKSLL